MRLRPAPQYSGTLSHGRYLVLDKLCSESLALFEWKERRGITTNNTKQTINIWLYCVIVFTDFGKKEKRLKRVEIFSSFSKNII